MKPLLFMFGLVLLGLGLVLGMGHSAPVEAGPLPQQLGTATAQPAGQPTGPIAIDFTPQTIQSGQTLTVTFRVNNIQNLYGFEGECRADTTVLTAGTFTNGTIFTPANAFTVVPGPLADGTWRNAMSLLNPAPAFSGSAVVFSLSYTVGSGAPTLNCTATAVNREGQNIAQIHNALNAPTIAAAAAAATLPPPTATALPALQPTQVPVIGSIQGRLGYDRRTSPAGILVKVLSGSTVRGEMTTAADGSFRFNNLLSGNYTIEADAPGYMDMQYRVTITNTAGATLPNTNLTAGDVDDNNVVDLTDAAFIGANFNVSVPPAPAQGDFNGDGRIELRDLVIVGRSFGTRGPVILGNWTALAGVSDSRWARMARGINIDDLALWVPSNTGQRITVDDFRRIKDMGFTYIRVPLAWADLWDFNSQQLKTNYLTWLDQRITEMFNLDLGVMLEIHILTTNRQSVSDNSSPLYDANMRNQFVNFWRLLATRYSTWDPEKLFLEPLNEPVYANNQADWFALQNQLITTIRQAAPQHTIIASSTRWSSLDHLAALTPVADRNVVYTFHYYAPYIFTHQGAPWAGGVWARLRNVPYPSSPERVNPLINATNDTEVRNQLRWYGDARWDANKIRADLQRAQDWARQHGVRIFCGEFGVYVPASPAADRVAYIRDVRTTLEQLGIAWNFWEYKGTMGLTPSDSRTLDSAAVQALGLRVVP
jgi:endoglucanase